METPLGTAEGAGAEALTALDRGRPEEALALARAFAEQARAAGDVDGDALLVAIAGAVAWDSGDLDIAERELSAAAAKGGAREAVIAGLRAALDATRGRSATARVDFDAAMARATTDHLIATFPLLEAFFDLAEARDALLAGDDESHAAHQALARARLAAAPASPDVVERAALRLLDRTIRERPSVPRRRPTLPAPARSKLTIGPTARWFRAPDGVTVDLGRRKPLRLLLARLAEARLAMPGHKLSLKDLQDAGWPNERVLPEAGAARVYTAVRALRDLGLRDVLLTSPDGYFLDPSVETVYVDTAETD
jgi:hypothetical protein